MARADKKKCPECGVEMNHNAEKVNYTAGLADPKSIDPELGGVLEEAYTCPGCGITETWKAQQEGKR